MTLGKGSIRSRLLLFMLVNALIPLIVIGVLGYFYTGRILSNMEISKMRDLLQADSREMSARLSLYLRPVRFLAEMPSSAFTRDDEISVAYHKSLIRYYQGFVSLAILTPQGFPYWIKGDKEIFPATGLKIPRKIADSGEGVAVISPGDNGRDTAVPSLVLLSRRTDGSYACGVLENGFLEKIVESLDFGLYGKVLLFNEKMEAVAFGGNKNSTVQAVGNIIAANQQQKNIHNFGIDCDLPSPYGRSLLYVQPLYGYGINLPEWTLAAVLRYDTSLGPLDNLRWYGLMLGVFSVAVTIFLAWRISLDISNPLSELSHLAQQVALGNLNVACRPAGWGELNSLGGSFNHMLLRLRKNRDIRASFKQEIRLRNRFEEKLKRARHAAEDASKSKSEFLSNVSHEIRTPLNAIMGYAEKLMIENSDKVVQHDLYTIMNESRNLLLLINDLLDHAKIEAGKLDLEYVAFDLYRLLSDIGESFQMQASDKKLKFSVEIQPQVPQYVMHDPLRLRQVLSNLLSNAIKFTHEGSVELRVESFTNDGRYAQTRFSVRDTGIGIPEDKQRLIFDTFSQADGSATREFGGIGLGASIASRLVTLMGGHMGLSSRSSEGSTFFFDLLIDVNVPEQDIAALKVEQQNQPQMFKGGFNGRALVAEDYEVNQELIRSQLMFLGMQVDIAANGRIALDLCHREKFDIVFMDLQMPEMDGMDATERILRECPLNLETPIIALTANADRGIRHQCHKLGMCEVLNKPTHIEELAGALERWLSENSSSAIAHFSGLAGIGNEGNNDGGTEQGAPNANAEVGADAVCSGAVVDLQEASRLFAGNMMVLKMSFQQFINSTEGELIPQLTQAIEEGDLSTASRRAHKIKGGAASICAGNVRIAAGKMEEFARDGDMDKCRSVLPELLQEFKLAREYIESSVDLS